MAAIAISGKRSVSGLFVAVIVAAASFALGIGGGYAMANHQSAATTNVAPATQVVDGPQSDLTRALPSAVPAGGPDSDLTRALPR